MRCPKCWDDGTVWVRDPQGVSIEVPCPVCQTASLPDASSTARPAALTATPTPLPTLKPYDELVVGDKFYTMVEVDKVDRDDPRVRIRVAFSPTTYREDRALFWFARDGYETNAAFLPIEKVAEPEVYEVKSRPPKPADTDRHGHLLAWNSGVSAWVIVCIRDIAQDSRFTHWSRLPEPPI